MVRRSRRSWAVTEVRSGISVDGDGVTEVTGSAVAFTVVFTAGVQAG